MYEFWIFHIKVFKAALTPQLAQTMWQLTGVGRLLVLDTRYLLEPGIYANPGKLQELVLYISVSLVLWSTALLPKPSQIMQNKTVDHCLTHQAAWHNWSVFVQDMPGKTPAIHLVWELSSTQKSAFIWASGPGEKGQGSWLLTFIFSTSVYMFS